MHVPGSIWEQKSMLFLNSPRIILPSYLYMSDADQWTLVSRNLIFESWHDKTNKMSVRPAKTQISLGIHPVWSVFIVCMKKAWVFSYPLSTQHRLWSDWADAQADLTLRWRTLILLVLSYRGSFIYSIAESWNISFSQQENKTDIQ